MRKLRELYPELLTELFFLQNGGNLMDYFSWKKRPNTLLACYLRSEQLDSEEENYERGADFDMSVQTADSQNNQLLSEKGHSSG